MDMKERSLYIGGGGVGVVRDSLLSANKTNVNKGRENGDRDGMRWDVLPRPRAG